MQLSSLRIIQWSTPIHKNSSVYRGDNSSVYRVDNSSVYRGTTHRYIGGQLIGIPGYLVGKSSVYRGVWWASHRYTGWTLLYAKLRCFHRPGDCCVIYYNSSPCGIFGSGGPCSQAILQSTILLACYRIFSERETAQASWYCLFELNWMEWSLIFVPDFVRIDSFSYKKKR